MSKFPKHPKAHGGFGTQTPKHSGQPKQPKQQKKQGSWMSRQKPGFLTGSVSGRQALKEIQAATNLEYNPLQRSIQGDLAGSQQREADIPGWFQDYQNQLQKGASQTAAAYGQAQQQLSARLGQAGQLDQANRADMQQKSQADATLRGVSVDSQGSQDSVNAASSRNTLQAGYGGMIATLGANQAGYNADKARIGKGEEINQRLKEQTRERGIRSDLRELAGKRGDFATKYLADLRESERKYALGKATIKGENSRASLSANTSAANNKRTTSTSRLNAQLAAATSSGNAALAAKIRKQIANEQQRGEKQRNRADNKAAAKRAKSGNKGKKK